MGEEQILQLAKDFLFSEAGRRLVGRDIDLEGMKDQILAATQDKVIDIEEQEAFANRVGSTIIYSLDYTNVDVTNIKLPRFNIKKPTLSREERQRIRQERREERGLSQLARQERRENNRIAREEEREENKLARIARRAESEEEREERRAAEKLERENERRERQARIQQRQEDRQQDRQLRRIARDENRDNRRLTRQEERDENKRKRQEEREAKKKIRKEKGGRVGQFIPRFAEYKLEGRVYDLYRKIPIEGIQVRLAIKDPVKGFPIPIGGEKRVFKNEDGKRTVEKRDVYTDVEGKFTIYVRLPYLPYNKKILLEAFLLYTNGREEERLAREAKKTESEEERDKRRAAEKQKRKEEREARIARRAAIDLESEEEREARRTAERLKREQEGAARFSQSYLPATQPIITREREVKTVLPEFPLMDLATAAEEELPEALGRFYPIYNTTRQALLNPKEQALIFRKQQILKSVRVIQTRLLPMVLELLLAFGISKLVQRNQKVCPSPEVLKANTERRNRVVRQLNQVYRQITINTAIAAALTVIAGLIKTNRSIILNLPLPLGAPIGVGVPYSAVAKLQEVQDVLEELESDNTEMNKQIINGLVLLTASVASITILLRLLDEMTEECAVNLNLQPEAISQELVDLTNEASEEGISTTNRVNGFTLEVQTIDKNVVGNLKRRQAVGKNSQGVILIKGDPSFSSSDQILINELAFYIQSNNLKAF